MIKRILAICALAAFIACEKATDVPANSSGLRVTVGSCDGKVLAKGSVDSTLLGTVHFQSRDSLSVTLPVVLLCVATYEFSAAYLAPDTLAFEAKDVGETRSRCGCNKEVTFEYNAGSGENLTSVKVAKFESQVFSLVSE